MSPGDGTIVSTTTTRLIPFSRFRPPLFSIITIHSLLTPYNTQVGNQQKLKLHIKPSSLVPLLWLSLEILAHPNRKFGN